MSELPGEMPTTAYEDIRNVIPPEYAEQMTTTLHTLSAYLIEGLYAVGGDLAIRYNLQGVGAGSLGSSDNRIDIEVPSLDIVDKNINSDFLVSHYHVAPGNWGLYLGLVHRDEGTQVDIAVGRLSQNIIVAPFDGEQIPINNAESLLADTVIQLLPLLYGTPRPVDARLLSYAYLLQEKSDPEVAEIAWQDSFIQGNSTTLLEVYESADAAAKENTELQTGSRRSDWRMSINCPECRHSRFFPLAPPSQLYNLIGHPL